MCWGRSPDDLAVRLEGRGGTDDRQDTARELSAGGAGGATGASARARGGAAPSEEEAPTLKQAFLFEMGWMRAGRADRGRVG